MRNIVNFLGIVSSALTLVILIFQAPRWKDRGLPDKEYLRSTRPSQDRCETAALYAYGLLCIFFGLYSNWLPLIFYITPIFIMLGLQFTRHHRLWKETKYEPSFGEKTVAVRLYESVYEPEPKYPGEEEVVYGPFPMLPEEEVEKILKHYDEASQSPSVEKSELEEKYPTAHSAMGGRITEARNFMNQGVEQFFLGQFEAAVASFNEASNKTPSDEKVWAAMVPPLLLINDYQKSSKAVEKASQIDKDSLETRLSIALENYHCQTEDSDGIPSELVSKKRNIRVPSVLEVPVNGELIRVEFGMVPKSARQWWGEGLRMMNQDQTTLARIMFQAAILEHIQFSHAWAGLSSALGRLGLDGQARAAEICSLKTKRNEELDEALLKRAGFPSRELWIYTITLYRIVYESNLRPLL